MKSVLVLPLFAFVFLDELQHLMDFCAGLMLKQFYSMKTVADYDWALLELAKDSATQNSERRLSQYVEEKIFGGRSSSKHKRPVTNNPLNSEAAAVENSSVEWPQQKK